MKLMTKEIEEKLKSSHTDNRPLMEREVVVKYFNPTGAGTWLITNGEKDEDGNWLLFGYCHIFDWEWGDVYLPELQELKLPPFGLGIERDLYAAYKPVKEFAKQEGFSDVS